MVTFKNNDKKLQEIQASFETSPRMTDIINFRSLSRQVGKVKNLFIGDSITSCWPLHEFFPNHSIINRGIGSDNVYGIYSRLQSDVFTYRPQHVFMLIGINGISEDIELIVNNIGALAEIILEKGSKVFLSSILPLRDVKGNHRFIFQDKIVDINQRLKTMASDNALGFLDYHSALKDDDGQLDADYASADGLHLRFEGYRKLSQIVAPYLETGVKTK